MSSQMVAPFKRGEVGASGVLVQLAGIEKLFENFDPTSTSSITPLRDATLVKCRWVLNSTGSTLHAGDAVKMTATARGTTITSLTGTLDQVDGIVDEFLPSTGCPTGSYCWITVKGQTRAKSDGTAITAGDILVASATAGELLTLPASAASAIIAQNQAVAVCGRAMATPALVAGTLFLVDFKPD